MIIQALTITKDNFDKEVMQSDKPVLLDFWSPTCGPCMMIGPTIDEIAAEQTDVKVGKVNVMDEPELTAAFGVVSIPMLVVIKDGEVINQDIGAKKKSAILQMLTPVTA